MLSCMSRQRRNVPELVVVAALLALLSLVLGWHRVGGSLVCEWCRSRTKFGLLKMSAGRLKEKVGIGAGR